MRYKTTLLGWQKEGNLPNLLPFKRFVTSELLEMLILQKWYHRATLQQLLVTGALLLSLCFDQRLIAQSSVAPKRYALLIAVNTYEDSKLNDPPLQYPESDAEEIGERLREGGYEVDLLLGPQATKLAIDRKLLAMNQKGNDAGAVLVGLFGHGVEYKGTDEAMFCPYDASMRQVKDADGKVLYDSSTQSTAFLFEPDPKSLVGMSKILTALKLCKAGNKVLLADCCRTSPNPARGRAFGSRVKLSELPSNTAALFACSTGEEAMEHPDWKHGAMTRAFLDVMPELSGEGNDVNRITGQMSRRISSMVRDVSKGQKKQTLNPIVNGIVELKLGIASSNSNGHQFTNSIGIVMKHVDAGEFLMGSTRTELEAYAALDASFKVSLGKDEQPQHPMKISRSYYMGVTEVTRGQFRKFVDATKFRTDVERDQKGGWGFDAKNKEFSRKPEYTWLNPGFEQMDSHPVVNVSWNDAVAFCEWLTKQEGRRYLLPTEAEWEFACRAGAKASNNFCCGNDPELLATYGNIADASAETLLPHLQTINSRDGFVFTSPVGRFRSNAFGLQDLHGNVWEWCRDAYGPYPASAEVAPDGPTEQGNVGRVIRGGSWESSAGSCRSALRDALPARTGKSTIGFRIALVPDDR